MKNAYSLSIYICSLGVFLYSSSAYSSFSYANLENQIKPNLAPESKPASYFTKLAAVHFVKDNSLPKFGSGGHDIKNDPKSCPTGTTWYGGSCQKNCDTNTYPYTDEPDKKKGNVVYEVCQGNIRFGYNSCNNGWLLNGAKCDVNPCTGYIYSSRPDSSKGTFEPCKSGDDTKYKYTSCNPGWTLSNGKCVPSTCDASVYPYTTDPGSTAGKVITCNSGTTPRYGYSNCNLGWYKSGGYCYENTCTGYPSTSQTITGCKTTAEPCQKGSNKVYKCSACYKGYSSSSGSCNKTCNYTETGRPANCASASSCVLGSSSGEKTYYSTSCTTCNNGWYVSNGSCIENACTGYPSTSQTITGCMTTAEPCQKGSNKVYKCSTCYTGYSLSNGSCNKTCNYTATGLPANCASAAGSCKLGSSSGETTYYATTCTNCKDAYKLNTTTKLCERYAVGDIYYYNNTAIGVVFSDDGNTMKVVGLNNISGSPIPNSPSFLYPFLANIDSSFYFPIEWDYCRSEASCLNDMEGKRNTRLMMSELSKRDDGVNIWVPFLVSSYAPSVCPSGSVCGVGNWYLPSLGELNTINGNFAKIHNALRAVGTDLVQENCYMLSSSTLATPHAVFYFKFPYSSYAAADFLKVIACVRPVFSIGG